MKINMHDTQFSSLKADFSLDNNLQIICLLIKLTQGWRFSTFFRRNSLSVHLFAIRHLQIFLLENYSCVLRLKARQSSSMRNSINVCKKFEKHGSVTPQHLWPKTKRTAASMHVTGKIIFRNILCFCFGEPHPLFVSERAQRYKSYVGTWRLNFIELTWNKKLTDARKQQCQGFR